MQADHPLRPRSRVIVPQKPSMKVASTVNSAARQKIQDLFNQQDTIRKSLRLSLEKALDEIANKKQESQDAELLISKIHRRIQELKAEHLTATWRRKRTIVKELTELEKGFNDAATYFSRTQNSAIVIVAHKNKIAHELEQVEQLIEQIEKKLKV